MVEEATASTQESAQKPRSRTWLAVLVAVGMAGAGAGIGTLVVGPRLVKRAQAATASRDSAAARKAAAPGVMHQIENLVLNPAGTGGTRFLMVTIAIETRDAATNEEMNARDAEVRDLSLRLLGSKTVDQLADVSQRDALRGELKARLSTLFAPGAIREIYFPQFVIQ